MTWLETIATGFESGEFVINRAMVTALAYHGLGQGLSGRQMLGSLRGMGLKVRTQTFYQAVRAAKAMQGAAAMTGLNPPNPAQIVTSSLFPGSVYENPQHYTSVVTVHYTQEVEGETVTLTKDLFIRSTDALTQAQVVQRAYDVWTVLQQNERYPHGEPVALEYIGTSAQ